MQQLLQTAAERNANSVPRAGAAVSRFAQAASLWLCTLGRCLQEQRSKIDTSALEASLDKARRLGAARQELQAATVKGLG